MNAKAGQPYFTIPRVLYLEVSSGGVEDNIKVHSKSRMREFDME